ncbi:MAG: hypothetical protein ACJ8C4_12665 [Gemmataceae bacterium]
MTEPHDEWANLADNLGVSDEPAQKPAEESAPRSETAPRGRGRRRSSEAGGEEAPKRRRRSPKPESSPQPEPESESMSEPFAAGLEPDVPEAAEDAAESMESSEDEPRKRRRRRPRRKKGAPEAGAVASGEVSNEPVAVGVEADDAEEADLTPIENYATLNIPSWQDLIDGLYKP